uniref:Gpcr rhodopsin superfamily n=1 Tax=Echinococcus granulosus TaxID=6210 RepID=A0A068WEC8_ECHGR|nr:gpcr rhodopsin superfamily [Echinococcus granulosus]
MRLLLKKYSPFAWFAIGMGCCDSLACFFYALGEIYRVVHNSLRQRWMGCAVLISKPAFWVCFTIRMALTIMEAWYLFTRLIFPSVYRRHGQWVILVCIFIFYVVQAVVADFVHSLTTETGRHMLCFETIDMFRLYGDATGSQKLVVAHHVAVTFILPLLFTRYLYINMLNALAESPNATHLLTYNSIQQMYLMNNLLPALLWSPFFILFFVFHFGTYLHFTQATTLHRVTFSAGLTYHALYPLLCIIFRRDVGGHLMGGLDVSHGHWAKNEKDDGDEFYGAVTERVAPPWSSSIIRPPHFVTKVEAFKNNGNDYVTTVNTTATKGFK